MAKIIKKSELRKVITDARRGRSVVFFSGAFDLFHYGHMIALKRASKLGDILVVQVDGNKLVKSRKGVDRPVLDQSQRAAILSALEFIDYVFISNVPSEDKKSLSLVKPDIYVRAVLPNETDADRQRREAIICKKASDFKIVWFTQTPEISTTKIISLMKDDIGNEGINTGSLGNSVTDTGGKRTVSIGISAHNEEQNIRHLLTMLLKQRTNEAVIAEIIVASDGSKDKTIEIVRSLGDSRIRVIEGKQRMGKVYMQSKITKQAIGEILVLLDADILPADELFIEKMIEPMLNDSDVALVSPDVVSMKPTNYFEGIISASHEFKTRVFRGLNRGNNIYLCHGRALAINRKLYRRIKWPTGYPEDAFTYLFCIQSGYKFNFAPKARVYFRSPSNLRDHLNQSLRFMAGKKKMEFYYGALVKDKYKIGLTNYFKAGIVALLMNPYAILSYVLIFCYIKFVSLKKLRYLSKWQVSRSSKRVLYEGI